MNLSAWADQVGVSKYTACRWHHAGTLPGPACRAGRLILAEPGGPPAEPGRTVIYARVSSADQRADLDRQVAWLASWMAARGRAWAKSSPRSARR